MFNKKKDSYAGNNLAEEIRTLILSGCPNLRSKLSLGCEVRSVWKRIGFRFFHSEQITMTIQVADFGNAEFQNLRRIIEDRISEILKDQSFAGHSVKLNLSRK